MPILDIIAMVGQGKLTFRNISKGKAWGLPQGLSSSPTLATLALEVHLEKWKNNLIMYLDDGILYGDDLTEDKVAEFIQDVVRLGVNLNYKKSG